MRGLPLLLLLAVPGLAKAPPEAVALFRQAYADTRPALFDAHLLMASAQARLTRLRWDLSPFGKKVQERARAASLSLDTKVEDFRPRAEVSARENSPSAAAEAAVLSQGALPRPHIPQAAAEQAEEILRMRARYDPGLSAAAGERAKAALAELDRRFGTSAPTAEQRAALARGRAVADDVESAARTLAPPSARGKESSAAAAARKRAREGLEGLREDARSLRLELSRLELHHRLNAHYAKHPDLF